MTLERTVMREQIKELIIKRILEGTYKPGERIVELQLVNELGVSQAPVREAIRELEAMRLVETQPYKGARVRAVSRAELAESYPVRAALEDLAAHMATPRIDAALLSQLDVEIQNMRDAARRNDQHGFLGHDARFHELIVESAANQVLLDTWSGLRIEAFTLVSVITSHLDLVAIANTHVPILEALRQGDPDLAGKVLRDHITSFGDLLTGEET
ncbi:GntR family transcriptional regulator [Amycolatopsis sp. Hca4]|uniref:GntR family transcriptional regulator n=1 Tax=Amycolatopsis sp. Hca4 TaxID=2742131 RepID=UPI00158FD9D3|nr:GntR family transcriptional regulator [Amycolatopsis sp. Hca4]QKV75811.1 GntR family transcriptional regulator [Amycolatopsis sp. Hca4]